MKIFIDNNYKDKSVYLHSLPSDVKEKIQKYFIERGSTLVKSFSKNVNLIVSNKQSIEDNKFPISTAINLDIKVVNYELLVRFIDKYNSKKKGVSVNSTTTTTTTTPTSNEKSPDIKVSNSLVVSRSPILRSTTSSIIKKEEVVVPNPTVNDPIVTLVVPPSGSNTGNYQIAIFGVGFAPGPLFRIQLGNNQFANNYEFHSTTCVLATVPYGCNLSVGPISITASNDGGKSYGYGIQYLVYDSSLYKVPTIAEQEATILKSQLANLKRAVSNIQVMESILLKKFATLSQEKLDNLYQLKLESGSDLIQETEDTVSSDVKDLGEEIEEDFSDFEDDDSNEDGAKSSNSLRDEFSDREIKIFISSPFKDMQLDRDQIVKVVIPKIRKLCIERDIIMTYVDLRWGVTSSQSEQGTSLLMCLKELEKSNVLIGLFGERYGFSSQERTDPKTQQLLTTTLDKASSEYSWVNKYRDSSITEIEFRMILNGHYQNAGSKSGYFYFRDPYYIEELPQKDKNNFVSEGVRSKEKLDKLKAEINKSTQFRSAEYRRPSNLSEVLYEDLEKYIDKKFPSANILTGFEKERFLHSVFSKNLTKIYIQNDQHYLTIDTFLTKPKSSVLLIEGTAGVGKSSLLSNWVKQHKEQHPEDLLVTHWIGASPNSNQHSKCLIRIMQEIRYLIELDSNESSGTSVFSTKSTISWIPDIPEEDSVSSEKISQEFTQFIQFTMTHPSMSSKRLVVVIDGLDKLDSRESSTELIWFPRQFPTNVKVLVSTNSSSRPSEVLKKRKHQVLSMSQFTEAERKSLVRLYLQKFAKKLSDQQEILIATSPSTSNPRFLQLLLDDICVFGDFERLGERILRLLKARNTSELYEIILDRIENDYDTKGKGFVKEFLRYIWAGRRGIELETLTTLLSRKGIDPSEWGSLLVLMESYINSSSGLLSFLNSDIGTAVEKKYITSEKIRNEIHSEIADAFIQSNDLSHRKIEELPYQLVKASRWEELKNCLCDLHMFDKLYTPNNTGDLISYWNTLEKQFKPPRNAAERTDPIPYNCSSEFKSIVSRSFIQASGLVIADVWYRVASFLEEISQYDGSEVLYIKSRELYVNNSQNLDAAKTDRAMGRMYHLMGKHEQAEAKFKQALNIYTKERGQEDIEIAITLNLLGTLATTNKKYEDAKRMLNQAMQICEAKYDHNQLLIADIAYSLGVVHFVEEARRLDIAEEYFQKALELTELKLGDMDASYARIVNRLGSVYIEKDQYKDAETCFKMALKTYEARLGIESSRVAQILRQLISLYEIQEEYKTAEQCAIRALNITKKIFGPTHSHVANILVRLGILYQSMEKKDLCLQTLNEARALREKEFGVNHKNVQQVVTIIKNITAPPPPPPVFKTAPPPPPPLPKFSSYAPVPPPPTIVTSSFPPGVIPPPPPPPPPFVPSGYLADTFSLSEVMRSSKPARIEPLDLQCPPPPPPPSYQQQQTSQQIFQPSPQDQVLQQLSNQMQRKTKSKPSQPFDITQALYQRQMVQKPQQQQMQQPQQMQQMQQPQQQQMQQPQQQQQQQQQQRRVQQPSQPVQQVAFNNLLLQHDSNRLKKVQSVQDRSNASDAITNLIGHKKNQKPGNALYNKLNNNMNESEDDIDHYFA